MGIFGVIISIGFATSGFAYMFNNDPVCSCVIGIVVSMLYGLGIYIQGKATYFWNNKFNKLLYYLSKNDREYNVISKEITYTCINEKEYKSEKNIVIYPTSNNVDRINEKFAWSARSAGARIRPLKDGHEIKAIRQEELWTCYSVYFNHTCQKHKEFETGSVIENLFDENGEVVPFLSATVERKTKKLIMRVKFDENKSSLRATFKVFTPKCKSKEIYSEELSFDAVSKGFTYVIDFPRPHWKYIISWE